MNEQDEFVARMQLTQVGEPQLVSGFTKDEESYWLYSFVIQAGNFDYRFPIAVQADIPAADRDAKAKEFLKKISGLIAKKISEW